MKKRLGKEDEQEGQEEEEDSRIRLGGAEGGRLEGGCFRRSSRKMMRMNSRSSHRRWTKRVRVCPPQVARLGQRRSIPDEAGSLTQARATRQCR